MSTSNDEVRRLLQSEKVTDRKKAKALLLDLVKKDSDRSIVTSTQWWQLLSATIEWENKELDDDRKKGKHSNYDNSTFYKGICKHATNLCPISATKASDIVQHSLKILFDNDVDNKYKDEHRYVLCDLLESFKFCQALDLSTIAFIFNYVKELFKSDIDLSIRSHLRLLKSLFKALFREILSTGILSSLFQWLHEIINCYAGDLTVLGLLTITISDCCSYLLEYHDLNCLNDFSKFFCTFLKTIIQQITSMQIHLRDPILRFIIVFINKYNSQTHFYLSNSCSNFLKTKEMLYQLYHIMASDEYLKSLILHAHNQSSLRTTKDGFISIFDDTKVRLNFEVCANILLFIHQNTLARVSSQSRKEETLTTINLTIPEITNNIIDYTNLFHNIFTRINNISLSHSVRTNTSTSTQPLLSQATISRPNFSQTAPPITTISGSLISSGLGANVLLEGLLLLLCTIFTAIADNKQINKNHPNNITNTSLGLYHHHHILDWLGILKSKLNEASEYPSEIQVHGSLMLALLSIAKVSFQTYTSLTSSTSSSNKYKNTILSLRTIWTQITFILLTKDVFRRYLMRCKRLSVSELLIELISNIFKFNLLEEISISKIQNILWQSPLFCDPRLVESRVVFDLMTSMIGTDFHSQDIPNSIGSIYCLYLDNMQIDTSLLACLPVDKSVNNGWLTPIYYSILWMNIQFESTASSRTAFSQQIFDFCEAMHKLIECCLYPSKLLFQKFSTLPMTTAKEYDMLLSPHSKSYWFETQAYNDSSNYNDNNNDVINMNLQYNPNSDSDTNYVNNNIREVYACYLIDTFGVLKTKLLTNLAVELKVDDNMDSITSWQLITIMLASCYISLCETLLSDKVNDTCTVILRNYLTSALNDCWKLLGISIDVILNRLRVLRKSSLSELCENIEKLSHRAATISDHQDIDILLECRGAVRKRLLVLVKGIRDLSLNSSSDTKSTVSSNSNSSGRVEVSGRQERTIGNKRSRPVVFEDDFMDTENTVTSSTTPCFNDFTSTSSGSRSNFSTDPVGDTLKAFLAICRALVWTDSSSDDTIIISEILNLLRYRDTEDEKISVTDEVYLYIGEKMAEICSSSSADTIFEIITSNTWDRRLGMIGFAKVLVSINNILHRADFNRKGNRKKEKELSYALLQDFIDIVFVRNTDLKQFLDSYWYNRVLQIKCGNKLFSRDSSLCKELFANCLKNGLCDVDYRVRRAAVASLPLLFTVFKNHTAVYRSMLNCIGLQLIEETNDNDMDVEGSDAASTEAAEVEIDPLLTPTVAMAIASMGFSSKNIEAIALQDLIMFCTSRDVINTHKKKKEKSNQLIDIKILLLTLIEEITIKMKYKTVVQFTEDHLFLILKQWLFYENDEQDDYTGSGTSSESKGDYYIPRNSPRKLVNFPYYIFGCESLLDFINSYEVQLLSVVCELQPTQFRWELLLEVSDMLGYGSQDSGIAKCIRMNLYAIIAYESFHRLKLLSSIGSITSSSSFSSSSSSLSSSAKSERILSFLGRIITENEIRTDLKQFITDVVLSFLSHFTYIDTRKIANLPNNASSSSFSVMESEINGILTSFSIEMCNYLEMSVGENPLGALLRNCNLMEICCLLRRRILSTASTASHGRILACLFGMVKAINVWSRVSLRAVYNVIWTVVKVAPSLLVESINLLLSLVQSVGVQCRAASNAVQWEKLKDVIPDILTDIISLKMTINLLLSSSRKVTETELFGSSNPHFLSVYFEKYFLEIAVIDTTTSDKLSDQITNLPSTTKLKDLETKLMLTIQEIFEWLNTTEYSYWYLSALLPLPQVFLNILYSDSDLSPQPHVQDANLQRCIQDLVANLSSLYSGESISLAGVWLRLARLRYLLQFEDQENCPTSNELWNKYPDLLASCISHIINLCGSGDDLLTTLNRDVIIILGKLGSPNLHSLSHSTFPNNPSDLLKQCNGDAVKLKSTIVYRLYGLLWRNDKNHDQQPISLASACLRNLTVTGSLKTLCPISTMKSSKEILDTYMTYSLISNQHHRQYEHRKEGHMTTTSFDRSTWDSDGKVYEDWISTLTSTLIFDLYRMKSSPTSTLTSSTDESLKNAFSFRTLKGFEIIVSDVFIACLGSICAIEFELAETLFPLIVFDLLNNNEQPEFLDLLTEYIKLYLLSSNVSERVSRLACKLFVFLLQQSVSLFKEKNANKRPTKRNVTESSTDISKVRWSLPFQLKLKVDWSMIAAAAVRCDFVCTALLFEELSRENSKHSSTDPIEQSEELLSSLISPNSINETLLKAYRGLHDPDSVHCLQNSYSLQTQACVYAHTGNWMEALTAYESIIQSQSKITTARTESDDDTYRGVAVALRALGAQHVLSCYSSALSSDYSEVQQVASESVWRMTSASRKADHILRKWSSDLDLVGDETTKLPLDTSQTSTRSIPKESSFELFNYTVACALKNLTNLNITKCRHRVIAGALTLFPKLLHCSFQESGSVLVTELTKMQQLQEILETGNIFDAPQQNLEIQVSRLMNHWCGRLEVSSSFASLGETILSLRLNLLEFLKQIKKVGGHECLSLMDQVQGVMRCKSVAHALSPLVYKLKTAVFEDKLIGNFNTRESSSISISSSRLWLQWTMYECDLFWRKGLTDLAVSAINTQVISPLRHCFSRNKNVNDETAISLNNLLSSSLRTAGDWLIQKKSACGTEILTDYLQPAVDCAVSQEAKVEAHLAIGNYTTRLYQIIKIRMSSAEWQNRMRVAEERKTELDNCMQLYKEVKRKSDKAAADEEIKALSKHLYALKSEVEIDRNERQGMEDSLHRYLLEALRHFSIVLSLSSKSDLETIFKIINLWLSNSFDEEVNNIMKEVIQNTSSYKFLPLTYQIFSRLGIKSDNNNNNSIESSQRSTLTTSTQGGLNDEQFQSVLTLLILKICSQHPHHTLCQLFALANENNVGEYSGASQYRSNISSSRITAANGILSTLKEIKYLSGLVDTLQILLSNYMTLAMVNTKKFTDANRSTDIGFRELQKGRNSFHECLKDSPGVKVNSQFLPCILTSLPPVRQDGDYSDIIRISRFLPTFAVTESGLSRPKIIKCEGSDGVLYKQLVKGGDDTRQDAVLQQVFEITNRLLGEDLETRRRNINIRTYRIIPLSPQTGIIEWVEDTVPFGIYLCDKDKSIGAHSKYYPSDWTHALCREKLREAQTADQKLIVFKEIYEHFHPAFRFFFLENFPDPSRWITCRLAYTRSVAVTSMVGYILGIGDRHAHNILIDCNTAEVVHIDFGIMFEQGRVLQTPETVPFRLTRDIVDGMGIAGYEGTFRRCCEEVLRVLRESHTQLLTVLEVVVYDPLYKWSLSPLQAKLKQTMNGNEDRIDLSRSKSDKSNDERGRNKSSRDTAERALLRIRDKLQGHDDPTGESLGVEGQVELLINEAKSMSNLSRLYCGWSPWL